MQPFVVIIPARRASTRLPGKMLADLAGTPMVVRVAQRAAASNASEVLIATDDAQIFQVVQSFGFRAVMTRSDHSSGTDRLAETVELLDLAQNSIVVNVQGDEPLIASTLINQVATLLASQPTAVMATCAAPIADAAHFFDPNIVKVVCDKTGKALYFSRAPIPWDRDALATESQSLSPDTPALHHIGLYAYRVNFLKTFPRLSRGVLEGLESLEQLRALEHGFSIAVQLTDAHPGAGVDTEADLVRVRQVLSTKEAQSG